MRNVAEGVIVYEFADGSELEYNPNKDDAPFFSFWRNEPTECPHPVQALACEWDVKDMPYLREFFRYLESRDNVEAWMSGLAEFKPEEPEPEGDDNAPC